ncbi:MAG: hypothetical protein K0M40_20835 [Prolixibacteraceae bacterium]|nr:hypothetical protein [Prolixibacteraceae bacterium]
MKKLFFILLLAGATFSGCKQTPKLDNDEALQIINKELNYPKVIDYDIFCSDPIHVKGLLDAGLETEGLITVQKTQKLKDVGNRLIQFTDKAKPYLLPTSDEDKALDIQKVKISDEDVSDLSVRPDSENKNIVWVEYTLVHKNITPFSVLIKRNLNEQVRRKVQFSSTDNGWILQKPMH